MNKIMETHGLNQLNENTPIARYFGRSKLIKLMNTQEIWFSNADKFPDKRERSIPEGFFKGWENLNKKNYKSITTAIEKSIKAYISCWTKFEKENYALWKIYDRYANGACLVTTVGKLQNAISALRSDMIICKVDYIDLFDKTTRYERPWIFYTDDSDFNNMRISENYKLNAYHYEEEIRGIIYSKQNQAGFGIKVDLSSLIDEVYISPFSSDSEIKKTIKQLKKRFDENIIKYSKIDEAHLKAFQQSK